MDDSPRIGPTVTGFQEMTTSGIWTGSVPKTDPQEVRIPENLAQEDLGTQTN